jgi:hypothetical protein
MRKLELKQQNGCGFWDFCLCHGLGELIFWFSSESIGEALKMKKFVGV